MLDDTRALQETARRRWRDLRLSAQQGGAFLRALSGEWLRPPPAAPRAGRLHVDGVQGTVEILRDDAGVAHIYAGSEADALFGLGFVHVQDRFWQMEFFRRVGAGRMAEVSGPKALPTDRLMRHIGLARAADAAWTATPVALQRRVLPYMEGVNVALETTPLPLEVRILDYQPEPWRPQDTALWGKLLAFMLSPAWEAQILRARLVERVGLAAVMAIDPGYPALGPVVAPPGAPYGALAAGISDAYARVVRQTGLGAPGQGSNNWALAGEQTASGRALFACDPHLSAVVPAHGYFVHLDYPGVGVGGASVPGLPGIIWGFNDRVAWGPTAGLASTQDVVVEEFDGDRYRTADGWALAGAIDERIAVRGHPDARVWIRVTQHGPVVSPEIPHIRQALALRSTVLDPATSGAGLLDLLGCGDFGEFRRAVAGFHEFNLVFAYADVAGHIGAQMSGAVPRRRPGSGWLPEPGWDPASEWDGLVPPDQLPHVFDPPQGRVWSANNAPVPVADLPFAGEFLDVFRAARIEQALAAHSAHDVDSARRLQTDDFSSPLLAIARHLGDLDAADEREARLLDGVRRWDGRAARDSVPAAVAGVTYSRLLDAVLRAKLGDAVDTYFDDVHAVPNLNLVAARAASLVTGLLDDAPVDWFGPAGPGVGGREVWGAALLRAFRDALALLEDRLGRDEQRWTWGRVRRITFQHGLGEVPALARLFNLGPYPIGSDAQAPLQAGPLGRDPFLPVTAVPALRLIVEMTDPPRAAFALAGGQVGRRGDPQAADLLPDWRAGRTRPLPTRRSAVEAAARSRLRLEPRTRRTPE